MYEPSFSKLTTDRACDLIAMWGFAAIGRLLGWLKLGFIHWLPGLSPIQGPQ
jgi:hypothetical protein